MPKDLFALDDRLAWLSPVDRLHPGEYITFRGTVSGSRELARDYRPAGNFRLEGIEALEPLTLLVSCTNAHPTVRIDDVLYFEESRLRVEELLENAVYALTGSCLFRMVLIEDNLRARARILRAAEVYPRFESDIVRSVSNA